MSASEIIKELPKLSEGERRAIREGLLEIANQDADVTSNAFAVYFSLIVTPIKSSPA